MKSGLLWFDKSTDYIETKIERAAVRYKEKFGEAPNIAYVNPGQFDDQVQARNKGAKIQIRTKHTIMPNHIWLGVSE